MFSAHGAIPGMLLAHRGLGKEGKKGKSVPKPPVPRPQESTAKSSISPGSISMTTMCPLGSTRVYTGHWCHTRCPVPGAATHSILAPAVKTGRRGGAFSCTDGRPVRVSTLHHDPARKQVPDSAPPLPRLGETWASVPPGS